MPSIDFLFPMGPRTLFTDRTNDPWTFFPMTGPLNTTTIQSVRVGMKMDNGTGDIRMKPAVRYSDDRVTWTSSPDDIGSEILTTDGDDFGAFATLPGTVKPWAQFGFLVSNISASNQELETCEGYMKLETRAC